MEDKLYRVEATQTVVVLAKNKAHAEAQAHYCMMLAAGASVRSSRILRAKDLPAGIRTEMYPKNSSRESIGEHLDREAAERTAKAEAMKSHLTERPELEHERAVRERLAELGLEPMPELEAQLLREEAAEDGDEHVCVGGTAPARRGREELERQLAEARGALREEIAKRLETHAALTALCADVRALIIARANPTHPAEYQKALVRLSAAIVAHDDRTKTETR